MFNLTEESILAKTPKNEYIKGLDYYKYHRIKSVQYNQSRRTFTSTVLGSKLYTQHLRFDADGKLAEADCTCPTGNDGWGCCKHMVAVLLLIREKDNQGFFRELRFRQAAKDIFSFFGGRQAAVRSQVFLEPTLELPKPKGTDTGKAGLPSLKLRIGLDRMYIVKDIKKLLYHMENNMEVYFGKKFTFTPSRHEFIGLDMELVNLIREIYEADQLVEKVVYSRTAASFFKDSEVFLTDSFLRRFLELYTETPFKAVIADNVYENIRIREEDVPVSFLLSGEGRDLLLSMDFNGDLLPLTEDGEYFLCGGEIYRISPRQRESLKPFYMAMMYQNGRKLRFIEEDKQRFISEILPFAEKAGKLSITEQVQSTIEKLPLNAEIRLDREGPGILADVRFIYGEHVINPFMPKLGASASDKLLIREIGNEEAVLDILAMADFKVKEGKIHLSGDDNIYEFIFKLVPMLQKHASVYYSESLKKMKLRTSLPFYARFGLNEETGMLEFSFNAEGIDRSELAGILESLRRKKKYYQLKDGAFLDLGAREFIRIGDFMEKTELTPQLLEKESVEIPRYRAAYLDQSLQASGIDSIERSAAFSEFVRNIREPEDMDFPMPEGLKGTLRNYQKLGFKWLKTLDFYKLGGILADDMGLGKTLQIIALLLSAKKEEEPAPSLIVVPTSLVFNWCAELDKFAPDLKYTVVTGNRQERQETISGISGYDAVITSYPLIRRDIGLYDKYDFRFCILDEAQYIKNPASRNARSVKLIKAGTRFALTGTPMENNLYELWSVFDFILPGYLYSYNKFNEKYVQPAGGEDGYEILGDLSRQIKPFILRRLKKDVLGELPEKIETTMLADLTEEQKKLYLAFLQDVKGEIGREIETVGFERSRLRILAALTRLRQLCCHPALFIENYTGESGKMLLLEEILQESIESGHKILLFSQFTGLLRLIRKRLEELKISFLYLDGSTPPAERGYLVNSFNEGNGSVFLLSLKAGGTGLNLTGADTVIHCDPWWNPAVEEQATDRSYRIGQTKPVYVIKLVAKGTIEEKILALQEKKRKLIDAVIQPGETLLSRMTGEEIRALFE